MLFQRVSHCLEGLCQLMHAPLEQAGGVVSLLLTAKGMWIFRSSLVYAVQTATLYTLTCKYFILICINSEPSCLYCNKIF